VDSAAVAEILNWNPKILGALVQNHVHFFFGMGFYDGPWQTTVACQFSKFLASAVAGILLGTPKYWGDPLDEGHIHFFLWV